MILDRDKVYFHEVSADKLNIPFGEIRRYMGYRKGNDTDGEQLISELLPEVVRGAAPRASFVVTGIDSCESDIRIGGMNISSKSLNRNLRGCDTVILLAATVGSGADRLISSYSVKSPASALAVSAIATALLESYADFFCSELKEHFAKDSLYLRPRFSPGYGDFDLVHQRDFITFTDASRRCGICCTDKLLLTPSKSITALAGISDTMTDCPASGCDVCTMYTCRFRRPNGMEETQ